MFVSVFWKFGNFADMVFVVVGNQKRALGLVSFGLPFDFEIPKRSRTEQLFAEIGKQLPTLIFVFGYATTNLVSAAMKSDSYGRK